MKHTRTSLFLLLAISFILCACPVSSEYPLGDKSSALPYDATLIGTWKTDVKEHEARVIKIENGSAANTYRITVVEKGEGFMANTPVFDGWVIELKKKKFLVIQEIVNNNAQATYYVYHLQYDRENATTYDISLKVNGTSAITSIKNYQEEAVASMDHEEFLSGKATWKKSK